MKIELEVTEKQKEEIERILARDKKYEQENKFMTVPLLSIQDLIDCQAHCSYSDSYDKIFALDKPKILSLWRNKIKNLQ